jgi:hypothetical protein
LKKRSQALLLIWWQWLGVRNGARSAWDNHRGELVLVGAGLTFLIVYNLASVHASLVQAAPAIRSSWQRILLAGTAASVVSGMVSGRLCARWAGRRVSAAWLAVLPWPAAERRRAARLACLAVSGVLTPVPAFCGWGVGHAVAAPHQVVATTAMGLCFMVAFLSASLPGAGQDNVSAEDNAVAGESPKVSLIWRLVGPVDQLAPRWAGIWAQGDDARGLSRWWLASLLVGGGTAGAVTLTQRWTWPSVVISVAGANFAYMVALRGAPLLSPVLRASPVRYAAACGAMARTPAVLSLLWAAIALAPALIVSVGSWQEGLSGVAALVMLNLLFTSAMAVVPSSRRLAALLYVCLLCVIFHQGLEYGMAYGALAAVAVVGVALLLWRQARRRFRGHA